MCVIQEIVFQHLLVFFLSILQVVLDHPLAKIMVAASKHVLDRNAADDDEENEQPSAKIARLSEECDVLKGRMLKLEQTVLALQKSVDTSLIDVTPTFMPKDPHKLPPTNEQIRKLAQRLINSFQTSNHRTVMVRVLRLSETPINNPKLEAWKRRSDKIAFTRGQMSLNLWLDVATKLDVFWNLYSYFVFPCCESYHVLPPCGTHVPSLDYPNSLRIGQPSITLPIHGDPEAPDPLSLYK